MQPIIIIMIYFWDKMLKRSLHVLEADIITIKKNIASMSVAECFKSPPLR